MSAIEQAIKHWELARNRTLATLDSIAELPDPRSSGVATQLGEPISVGN
ncbi:MAG: hypothetical protein R3C11_09740 [Planctomycetaceae bacterium]